MRFDAEIELRLLLLSVCASSSRCFFHGAIRCLRHSRATIAAPFASRYAAAADTPPPSCRRAAAADAATNMINTPYARHISPHEASLPLRQ